MRVIVGVVTALAREARLVRRAASARGMDAQLRLACCGMGHDRARAAARELAAGGAALLLVTGYAGALDERLAPGDLVLATDARRAGARYPCDLALAALAADALAGQPGLLRGPLASVDRPVDGAAARRDLARRSGAWAVDMESAAVGEEAARRGVPWIALRAVSDGVTQRVPPCLERMLDAYGVPSTGGFLRAMARDPLGMRHLPALARGARRADRALEAALLRLLPALAGAGA